MTDAGPPPPATGRARRRLLVAVVLEGPVADEVTGLRRALTGSEGHLAPHVTLVPPVNVADAEVPAALAVVREAAAASAPLRLELGPPGTFPRPRAVLYLAVGGDLAALEALRRSAGRPPLAPPEARPSRPFVPHVTLARLDQARATTLAELLGRYRAVASCASVQLLEERAVAGDRRWEVVAAEALGGRAVRQRGGLELTIQLGERLDPEAAAALEAARSAEALPGAPATPARPYAFVARRDGAVVGAATGTAGASTFEVSALLVVAPERGRGTGTRLLEAVERYAVESGAARVRLWVPAGGEAARLLERRGYRVTGSLARWRDEDGRDAVAMERSLRGS